MIQPSEASVITRTRTRTGTGARTRGRVQRAHGGQTLEHSVLYSLPSAIWPTLNSTNGDCTSRSWHGSSFLSPRAKISM